MNVNELKEKNSLRKEGRKERINENSKAYPQKFRAWGMGWAKHDRVWLEFRFFESVCCLNEKTHQTGKAKASLVRF